MATIDQASQIAQMKEAIAALKEQRTVLGDAVVETSLISLRKQLAELEGQKESVDQQRKLVTILFTDVAGSTRIARQLDPEEVIDTMDAALKRLAEPVAQHGGHVTRFQGDGFKAVFGLPVAHENDPEQAIRAGLGILKASQKVANELEQEHGIQNFQVRVGINTGLVASGGLTEAEDTIMGETVNLTARLESAAPPGGLLISHNTYRHVRGIFNVEPTEPVAAKGFPEPVKVYLVKSAKPRAFRVMSRSVEGIETRMIGRANEQKILQDALRTAIEDSEGQVVTVLGEAGVGKSRLLYEFQDWIELLPQRIWLFQGRARPETQNLPYALLRDLFAYRFQIQDGDPPERVRGKFERGIGEAFQTSGPASTGESHAHLLGQLLGVDFSDSPHLRGLLNDPQAIHNRALESLVDYFSAICAQDPAVIFLEDLHWADDSSLDVINYLGRRGQNLPLLIVGLARHRLIERRPHWGEGQLYHRKIHLEPLSKRESRLLVQEILQKLEQVPVELRELVVGGAEGNPFYIEELVKMLVEREVILTGEERWEVQAGRLAQVEVPSTLTGVLQARLDGLPEEERAVLQQASVVGRVFWDRAVEHIQNQQKGTGENVAGTLAGLREKELVFRREESLFAQAYEYIFKHEVLREVTYESVLKKLRRLYHGWAAEWLIAQSVAGGEEYSGLIAVHLERAGRTEQALDYFRRAGENALASYANAEAENYFRKALELDPSSSNRPALLGGLAEALVRQGYLDRAIATWKEGLSLYQAQREQEGMARLYTAVIRSLAIQRPNEAVKLIEIALPAVEGLQSSSALGHLLHQSARAYFFSGQKELAEPLCRQALAIAERFEDLELQADTLATLGLLYDDRPDEAIRIMERAVELAEEHGFLYVASRAHNNLGGCYSDFDRDIRLAVTHNLRALEISRQLGDTLGEEAPLYNLINNYLVLGSISAAQEKLDDYERLFQKLPQLEVFIYDLPVLRAQLAAWRGELETAHQLLTKTIAENRQTGRVDLFVLNATGSFLHVIRDMHRYLGWNDWPVVEELLKEVMQADYLNWIEAGRVEAWWSIVHARQGRVEQAQEWLQRAQAQVPADSLKWVRSNVMVAEVELSIAKRSWEEAIAQSKALHDWYIRTGLRLHQGIELLDRAEIHVMRGEPGDRERAIELYGQAKEIFVETGATGYEKIVEGRLSLFQGSLIRPKE